MKTINFSMAALAVMAVFIFTACENLPDKQEDGQNTSTWKTSVFELDPSYHYVPGAYDFSLSEDFHVLDEYCEKGFNTSREVLINRPYTYKSVEGPYNYDLCVIAPKGAELFLIVNGDADGKIIIDNTQDYHKNPYDKDYHGFTYYIDHKLRKLEYILVEEYFCRLNLVVFQEGPVTFKIVMKKGQVLFTPYNNNQQYFTTFTGVTEDELIYYGEWESPVLSIPDGYHIVPGTADFINAEIYGREKTLVYNPNYSNMFFPSSPSILYLIKAGQPYHHPPEFIKGGKSRIYQLSTNGNGDAILNTNMWDSSVFLGISFVAYDTGYISFFCNWLLNNYDYETSFKVNFYAVDGFIIDSNSSVNSSVEGQEERTYQAALEGRPRKYLNVSFNYSAVSETNFNQNRFAVIIRDFFGNILIEDNYAFPSPVTTEASSKRPYSEYKKSFDISRFESRLDRATIEVFQHAGDWSMSMGPAVYVWSDEPHYDIGGRK